MKIFILLYRKRLEEDLFSSEARFRWISICITSILLNEHAILRFYFLKVLLEEEIPEKCMIQDGNNNLNAISIIETLNISIHEKLDISSIKKSLR